MRTVPVKYSAGPLAERCEPARLMSIDVSSVLPFVEDVRRDRYRGHRVRPPRVEGQVRNHLGGFDLREAVIHRTIQMERNLGDLTRCDQRAHRHHAAVTWREIWSSPEIEKQ